MKKIIFISITLFLFTIYFYNYKNKVTKYSDIGFYFNTIIEISIYHNNKDEAYKILEEAFSLCEKYENTISKTIDTSFVSELNLNKNFNLDESFESEVALFLIEKSIFYSKMSNGLFDITIEPLVSLWGFADEPKVPSNIQIDNELQKVGYENIQISKNQIILNNNSKIDLGGIAKGFIADEIKQYLIEQNIKHGIINLGGNVLVINNDPHNTPFNIGLKKPEIDTHEVFASIQANDKSIVTSAITERFFEEDNILYHHIINPFTGRPEENDILSVTIISDKSIDGDALSTSIFLMGIDEGLKFINDDDTLHCLFINNKNEIFFSNNFIETFNFKFLNGNENTYKIIN